MSLKTFNIENVGVQLMLIIYIRSHTLRRSRTVKLNSTIYATFKIACNLETCYYVMLSCLVLTSVIYTYYVISKLLMYTKHYNHRRSQALSCRLSMLRFLFTTSEQHVYVSRSANFTTFLQSNIKSFVPLILLIGTRCFLLKTTFL